LACPGVIAVVVLSSQIFTIIHNQKNNTMKKTILIAALFLSTAWASFAADGTKPSRRISASFKKEFSGASQVSWQKNQNYVEATFHMKGQIMTAYYTQDGALAAVVHNMLSDQLPACLLTNLKKNFNDYWISGLFEEVKDGTSHYVVTLENADEQMTMKSVNTKDWIVENRSIKLLL
jgi:hypothetical protein